MSCLTTNSFQNPPSTSTGLQFSIEDMSSLTTNSFQNRSSTSTGLQFSIEEMSSLATNSFQNRPSTSSGLQFSIEEMSSFTTNSFQNRPSTSTGLQFSIEEMSTLAANSFQNQPSTSTGIQFSINDVSCVSQNTYQQSAAAEAVALSISLDNRTGFHSPDIPMRYFVNDALSVCTEDSPQCGICDDPVPAFSKCMHCNVLLCDVCVYAHQRARLTKEHPISRLPNLTISTTPPNSVGSGESSSQVSGSPPNPMRCAEHRKPKRLYCHSCKYPTCDSCYLSYHDVHNISYLDEAVDAAKDANHKLHAEIRAAINGITEIIDNIQGRSETSEQKYSQTAADVRNAIQRYKCALDERETEMLKSIDSIRQMKGKQFMGHIDNLKIALTKLSHISDLLHSCSESKNALEILAINEQAIQTLKLVQAMRPELLPSEDESVMFLPPDNGVLRAISSLSVGNNTTAASADSLPPSPPSQPPSPPSPVVSTCGGELANLLGNRPIYNVRKTIVAQSYRMIASLVFGEEGNHDGQLCRPWGVCCDRMGNIIVADRSNNRIQIFDCRGKFLHKFGSHGNAKGQFDRPAGVTINPSGQIVVADKDNHRIQIFKMDGTFIRTFGEKGTRLGQFNYPWDVACNSVGHIIVSDTRNHRVQLFTSEGMYLNKYGFEGSNNMWKHFDSPRGVCFTPSGGIVVTDFNNHRVVVVDPYFAHAQYLGQEGSGSKQFLRPQGVVCDDDGNIIIADSRNNRIQVYHHNGSFLWSLGRYGKGPGQLDRPSGICLNPDGRIVVVDFGNNRIQIF